MSAPNVHEFTVPIDADSKGTVVVLWPCDGRDLRRYVVERFGLDSGERDTWDGKCYFSKDLDHKLGQPSVVIALRIWELNLKNPAHWESNSHLLALLAHECFHAAEWMLRQIGGVPPATKADGEWEAWEDAAYLLQRIMRRSLEGILPHAMSLNADGMSTDIPSDELSPEDQAAWAQSGHLPREIRAVNTIENRIYVDSGPFGPMSVEPVDADIQAAIDARRFSTVIFSEQGDGFSSQLWIDCGGIPEKYIPAKKAEHAARIAGFVAKGWKSPLRIRPDGVMMDGTHRLKAARFKGLEKVECWIQAYP